MVTDLNVGDYGLITGVNGLHSITMVMGVNGLITGVNGLITGVNGLIT